MSIFAGDFKDPEGVPFDPHSYAHDGAGSTQVMQRRYHGNTNKTWRVMHVATLRRLQGLWINTVPDAEKALWAAVSLTAVPARDYVVSIAGKGFVAFANANWPVVYGYGGDYLEGAPQQKGELWTFELDSARASDGRLQFTVNYVTPPALELPAVTYFYQIHPKRLNSKRFLRFTRHILTFDGWEPEVEQYELEAKAAWPFAVGDEVIVAARHRWSSTWNAMLAGSAVGG